MAKQTRLTAEEEREAAFGRRRRHRRAYVRVDVIGEDTPPPDAAIFPTIAAEAFTIV